MERERSKKGAVTSDGVRTGSTDSARLAALAECGIALVRRG